MRLEFQTKAKNLLILQDKLKSARVLPLVITSLDELEDKTQEVLEKIKILDSKRFIIRSSSKSEDSTKNSNAGAFLSLANISNDKEELLKALKEVGNSMPSTKDEILIQPMLEDIKICGVAFSVDKDNFAPYYCLSYDKSGSNSSITDGSSNNAYVYFHYRDYLEFKDHHNQQIITMIKELEKLFDCNFLDVEFAFATYKGKRELFCLQ
ncbi:hypothetical protein FSE90_02880, partial [Campylobacter novaezeelandiae]|nr:hypothetical protein [Campylobacter novaezeelandiae]